MLDLRMGEVVLLMSSYSSLEHTGRPLGVGDTHCQSGVF